MTIQKYTPLNDNHSDTDGGDIILSHETLCHMLPLVLPLVEDVTEEFQLIGLSFLDRIIDLATSSQIQWHAPLLVTILIRGLSMLRKPRQKRKLLHIWYNVLHKGPVKDIMFCIQLNNGHTLISDAVQSLNISADQKRLPPSNSLNFSNGKENKINITSNPLLINVHSKEEYSKLTSDQNPFRRCFLDVFNQIMKDGLRISDDNIRFVIMESLSMFMEFYKLFLPKLTSGENSKGEEIQITDEGAYYFVYYLRPTLRLVHIMFEEGHAEVRLQSLEVLERLLILCAPRLHGHYCEIISSLLLVWQTAYKQEKMCRRRVSESVKENERVINIHIATNEKCIKLLSNLLRSSKDRNLKVNAESLLCQIIFSLAKRYPEFQILLEKLN